MAIKQPESMDDLVYFTDRDTAGGPVRMWVFRKECPECGKMMGKPKDAKGKVKIRASEYVCECGHTEQKAEYEDSLIASAEYTCNACGKEGEAEVPFKRKLIKGVQTVRITCDCGAHLDVTKKMKEKAAKN